MTEMVLLNFSSSCKTVINCAFNLKNPLFDQHNIKRFIRGVDNSDFSATMCH